MLINQVKSSSRILLCLWLAGHLALPPMGWAAAAARDLDIEALKRTTTLWVLAIGISDYADARINLKYADNDAEKLAELLATQEGVLFNEVKTRTLLNEAGTRENILRSMSEFLGQAAGDDVVVIFVAGHGLQDRKTGTYYFVPHNASGDNLVYAGLPMPMFEETVKRLETHVRKTILLLDTCHAGAMSAGARAGVNVGEDLSAALQAAEGRYILSASLAGEESFEDEKYRLPGEERAHGAFTYSLLKGLEGAASSDGVVWLTDLFGHVSKEVPRLTGGVQHPHSDIRGTDLPLFVVGEGTSVAAAPALEQKEMAPLTAVASAGGKGLMWLWVGLGALVAGGAGLVLAGGGGDSGGSGGPDTGTIEIDSALPSR